MPFGTIFLGKGLFLRITIFAKDLFFITRNNTKILSLLWIIVIRNAMDNRKLCQKYQYMKNKTK